VAEKTGNLLKRIKEHVQNKTYMLTVHALDRQSLRNVSLDDVLFILKNGRHEEEKPQFEVKTQIKIS